VLTHSLAERLKLSRPASRPSGEGAEGDEDAFRRLKGCEGYEAVAFNQLMKSGHDNRDGRAMAEEPPGLARPS